jgi:hypothetical protein
MMHESSAIGGNKELHTNVVQPEVRAMFKQSEDDSETVHSITVCEDRDTNGVNFSTPILNATQSQGELFRKHI